ncbi:alpha-(1,3)-fucosyltransferase 11 [Trichonephila clavata]|uniref:Fucosyltransferase n=1 Tax=Trichonephila clavata TaxID=2740835 RepID=A0A8X6KLL1_TRICU|nr:alpha-(1,3)-fucosyltransferase 11 [Trichonephila clavata]
MSYFLFIRFILIISVIYLNEIESAKDSNNKNLPLIIWWSDLLFPHEENVTEIKCQSGKCLSSKRRNPGNDHVPVAYILYGTDFSGEKLPLPRKNNHLWALLHEESPMNNYIFSHTPGIKLFNYTATFSRESDFPLTTQFIPSLEYFTERKPVPIEEKNKYRKKGLAPVLYLQSHCNVASDRDRYVKQLMKYMDVDSYGKCLHNKDLPPQLLSTETYDKEELFSFISKYKFHIAYENALCDDYITEKLYRALYVGSIPIYKGSDTVKDWLPSNESVIMIDDFSDPYDLANFIEELDQSDRLYNQYLEYKEQKVENEFLKDHLSKRSWGVNDPNRLDFLRGFECFICDKIQKPIQQVSIANRKHMNCPQPHQSVFTLSTDKDDEWMQEDWVESYWFAKDHAKAIEDMLQSKENKSSNFFKYISKFKYY